MTAWQSYILTHINKWSYTHTILYNNYIVFSLSELLQREKYLQKSIFNFSVLPQLSLFWELRKHMKQINTWKTTNISVKFQIVFKKPASLFLPYYLKSDSLFQHNVSLRRGQIHWWLWRINFTYKILNRHCSKYSLRRFSNNI